MEIRRRVRAAGSRWIGGGNTLNSSDSTGTAVHQLNSRAFDWFGQRWHEPPGPTTSAQLRPSSPTVASFELDLLKQ